MSELFAFCFWSFEVGVKDHIPHPTPHPPYCPVLDAGAAEKVVESRLWRMLPGCFLDRFRAVVIYGHKSAFWTEAEVTISLPPPGQILLLGPADRNKAGR